jgi:hypothetical protein
MPERLCIAGFARVATLLLACAVALGVLGCEKEPEPPVDHTAVLYKGVRPIEVRERAANAADGIAALERRIDLRYPMIVGDTLDVCILEFKSDVYAMDYYLNSGRFQGLTPILRGEHLEQSIRSDARIFIFTHDSFRRYERIDLENYVRSFPGYHGGFPQEFLSLPFEHREVNRTSIQTKNFLGVESFFPVLVQSYRDANLQWNVARSWEQVEEGTYHKWAAQLKTASPKGIARDVEVTYFTAGEGVNGMATHLPGGRVVVVWGYLSWFDLERKFFVASDRIYEARY